MTNCVAESPRISPQKPAFLVRVTGYIELAPDEIEPLIDHIKTPLRFLSHRLGEPGSDGDWLTPVLKSLRPDRVEVRADSSATWDTATR